MSESITTNHYLKFTLSICIVLIIQSCSAHDKNSIPFFDRDLDYLSVDVSDSFMFEEIFNPARSGFRVINDKVYVPEVNNDEVAFHVLNIVDEEGSLVYENGLGRRGQGPEEFLEINDIINTDSLIYIYDGNQLKMVRYDPTSRELASYDDFHLRTTGRPTNIYSFAEDQFIGIASRNGVMMQYFHWYTPTDGTLWKQLAESSNGPALNPQTDVRMQKHSLDNPVWMYARSSVFGLFATVH